MPEDIEKIMRAIHILISRGEKYNGDPGKVVVTKRELFDCLEQLNRAVADAMDSFEQTTAAKARARRELEETGMEIISNATAEAEDVYAASLLYTDGAINELYDDITNTRVGMRREFERFEDRIDERLEVIRKNQKELMDTLKALQQGNKYLGLIEDYNRRLAEAEKKRAELEAANAKREAAAKQGDKPKGKGKNKNAGMQNVDDIISGKAFEKTEEESAAVIPDTLRKRRTEPHAMGEEGRSDVFEKNFNHLLEPDEEDLEDIKWPDEPVQEVAVDVQFNTNWGTRENNVLESGRARTKRERDREKKHVKKPDKKKKSKYDFDDEEITLAVEPEDDPDRPIVLTSQDLDAEYERWQAEQEKAGTAGNDDEQKSGKGGDLISKAAEMLGLKKK